MLLCCMSVDSIGKYFYGWMDGCALWFVGLMSRCMHSAVKLQLQLYVLVAVYQCMQPSMLVAARDILPSPLPPTSPFFISFSSNSHILPIYCPHIVNHIAHIQPMYCKILSHFSLSMSLSFLHLPYIIHILHTYSPLYHSDEDRRARRAQTEQRILVSGYFAETRPLARPNIYSSTVE